MTRAPTPVDTMEAHYDYYVLDTAKRALRTNIEIVLDRDPKWVVNFICDIASRIGRVVTLEDRT